MVPAHAGRAEAPDSRTHPVVPRLPVGRALGPDTAEKLVTRVADGQLLANRRQTHGYIIGEDYVLIHRMS